MPSTTTPRFNHSGPDLIALGLIVAFGWATWVWRRRRAEAAERGSDYRPPQGSSELEFDSGAAPPAPPTELPDEPAGSPPADRGGDGAGDAGVSGAPDRGGDDREPPGTGH